MNRRSAAVVSTVLLLVVIGSGCSASESSAGIDALRDTWNEDVPPVPDLDPVLAASGDGLYQANCASCHGADLSGAEDWKTPDTAGLYPPPPLGNSGHAWHHPDRLLNEVVLDGSPVPESAMVGFRDQLSDSQIEAVLEYLKSAWGTQERQFQWMVTWQERERDR